MCLKNINRLLCRYLSTLKEMHINNCRHAPPCCRSFFGTCAHVLLCLQHQAAFNIAIEKTTWMSKLNEFSLLNSLDIYRHSKRRKIIAGMHHCTMHHLVADLFWHLCTCASDAVQHQAAFNRAIEKTKWMSKFNEVFTLLIKILLFNFHYWIDQNLTVFEWQIGGD